MFVTQKAIKITKSSVGSNKRLPFSELAKVWMAFKSKFTGNKGSGSKLRYGN